MISNYRYILIAVAASTVCVLLWLWIPTAGNSLMTHLVDQNVRQVSSERDPCWFLSLREGTFTFAMLEERNSRLKFGYSTEIAVSEALRIFNEENQCSGLFSSYPPLTEDELIAAIVAAPDEGYAQSWAARKDILWRIAKDKLLPKGSLLVAATGAREQGSPLRPNGTIAARGITILLLLDLDVNSQDEVVARQPGYSLVIRKMYTHIDIVK